MGAYVSVPDCERKYHVVPNCTITYTNSTNTTIVTVSDMKKGEFEGDGDIAGPGITACFMAVTSLALALSMLSVLMRMWKYKVFPFRSQQRLDNPYGAHHGSKHDDFSNLFEAMILSCSDTQIFTGAAYALTLRYFRGCTISAYHYDIVANMMLLTCATHLMAITVVREYWKYPWLAVVRVVCSFGVFLVTGLLLANQNAMGNTLFPTSVPNGEGGLGPLIFTTAACFQRNGTGLLDTMDQTWKDPHNGIVNSQPRNRIEGWNKYIIILLWFIASTIAELVMFVRRGKDKPEGLRRWVYNKCKSAVLQLACCCGSARLSPGTAEASRQRTLDEINQRNWGKVKYFGYHIVAIYITGGVGICTWTVVVSWTYISDLRRWVQQSGWLQTDEHGNNSENDATSFGQLVPILLNSLIFFTLLQMANEAWANRQERKRRNSEALLRNGIGPKDQTTAFQSPLPSKNDFTTSTTPVLPTPLSEVQPSISGDSQIPQRATTIQLFLSGINDPEMQLDHISSSPQLSSNT